MPEPAREYPSVLVTGATGLVGSELVRILLDEDYTVRILRRESSSMEALGSLADDVDHAIGDLTDPWSVRDAVKGVDVIFHVAAKLSGAPPPALKAVNVDGTKHLVDAALEAGVDRFVHTSSIATLGRPTNTKDLIDEKTPWEAASSRSSYARSKRKSELEVFRGIAEGLDAVVVNPGFIFGVGRSGENTRLIVDAVRRGWAMAAPSGSTIFVDARDVAKGLLRAHRLGETGERYILGGENLSWKKAISVLAEAFDQPPPRLSIPPVAAKTIATLLEGMSAIVRKRSPLTRSMAVTMSSDYRYDTRKAKMELACQFRPFSETAAYIAQNLSEPS